MNSSIGRCLIGLVFAGAAGIANASLIGSTVYGFAGRPIPPWNLFSGTRALVPALVGDGVEFFGSAIIYPGSGVLEVAADFTSDTLSISITNNTNNMFSLPTIDWIFGGQDWVAAGVTGLMTTESSFPGEPFFDLYDDHIRMRTMPGEFAIGQTKQAVYEIRTQQGAAPVPATLALFSLGLAGLGWMRYKKA